MRRIPWLVLVVALAACGDDAPADPTDAPTLDGGANPPTDATVPRDADPADAAVDAPVPDAATPPRELPALPASAIDDAIAAPLGWFGQNSAGTRYCADCTGASIVLALAAHSGEDRADARLLEQIRRVIANGRDPFGTGAYMAQHERLMTAMFAIAKRTPRVWDQLTADEVARIDLAMEGTLVGSAYTTADRTNADGPPTSLTGSTNLNRGWNPNYREGMIGAMIVGTLYFGGREATEAVLDDFDHAAFVAALEDHGLTNMLAVFTGEGPSGAQIEAGIEGYRYLDLHLGQLPEFFVGLTEHTFGRTVECAYDGVGIDLGGGESSGTILAGCDELPNLGAAGMLLELHGVDGSGPRSSLTYAFDGFRPNLVNHVTLIVYDALPRSPELDAAFELVRVGTTDLRYKLEHGYRSYANGSDRGVLQLEDGRGHGMEFLAPLYEAVAALYAD